MVEAFEALPTYAPPKTRNPGIARLHDEGNEGRKQSAEAEKSQQKVAMTKMVNIDRIKRDLPSPATSSGKSTYTKTLVWRIVRFILSLASNS